VTVSTRDAADRPLKLFAFFKQVVDLRQRVLAGVVRLSTALSDDARALLMAKGNGMLVKIKTQQEERSDLKSCLK